MAEGADGEEEIQFLRTVSDAAASARALSQLLLNFTSWLNNELFLFIELLLPRE